MKLALRPSVRPRVMGGDRAARAPSKECRRPTVERERVDLRGGEASCRTRFDVPCEGALDDFAREGGGGRPESPPSSSCSSSSSSMMAEGRGVAPSSGSGTPSDTMYVSWYWCMMCHMVARAPTACRWLSRACVNSCSNCMMEMESSASPSSAACFTDLHDCSLVKSWNCRSMAAVRERRLAAMSKATASTPLARCRRMKVDLARRRKMEEGKTLRPARKTTSAWAMEAAEMTAGDSSMRDISSTSLANSQYWSTMDASVTCPAPFHLPPQQSRSTLPLPAWRWWMRACAVTECRPARPCTTLGVRAARVAVDWARPVPRRRMPCLRMLLS